MPSPEKVTEEMLAAVEEAVHEMAHMILLVGTLTPMVYEPDQEEFRECAAYMADTEQAMQNVARLFMPEKHALAMRIKQRLLNRMNPGAN